MSFSVVDHKFNVNESTIWYIQRKEEEIRSSSHEAAPQSAKLTSVVCDEAMRQM